MAATRIYAVTDKAGAVRLVEATHPSHALRHAASTQYTVTVATQQQLVDLVRAGAEVERIRHEQTELTTND